MSKKRKYYVYGYVRLDTNTYFYIGKGKDNRCFRLDNRNKYFTNIFNKVKCVVEILYDNLTEDEAFQLEVDIIYDLVFNEGYSINIKGFKKNKEQHLVNETWGGEGISGYKRTEESKKIIGKNSKANWENENFRKKQSKSHKKVWQDKEYRIKMSDKLKGRKLSEKTRKKMSESRKGHETSEETRKKISEANKGKHTKTIYIIELNMTFYSITECAEYFIKHGHNKCNKNSMKNNISRVLNGKSNTLYGYHIIYAEDRDKLTS